MVTSSIRSRETCRSQSSSFNRMDGRHVGTRTPDLYRVNFEVRNLKLFTYLAFPHFLAQENAQKQPSFDGDLMASSRGYVIFLEIAEGLALSQLVSLQRRLVVRGKLVP